MKQRVLVSAPPILPHLDNYRGLFAKYNIEVLTPDFDLKECLSESDLHRLLKDVDGILCGDDKLSAEVLKKANKLKAISKWGTGIDSIDSVAAEQLGIKVRRVVGVFADPVADSVLTYMLLFSRKVVEKDKLVRAGDWYKVKSFTLREQSLGVIGVGHIGKAVVRRAAAFGMKIYCCDIKTVSQEFLAETGAQQVTLEELLAQADFVSLNCDLNKSSHHLINQNSLKLMKPNAVLINTARGPLVNEAALIQALSTRQIGGAALDVFEVEPLPIDSQLRTFQNVLLSPHNSNGSVDVFNRVDQAAIQNLLEELVGAHETKLAHLG